MRFGLNMTGGKQIKSDYLSDETAFERTENYLLWMARTLFVENRNR